MLHRGATFRYRVERWITNKNNKDFFFIMTELKSEIFVVILLIKDHKRKCCISFQFLLHVQKAEKQVVR